jgi:hypothetical protein
MEKKIIDLGIIPELEVSGVKKISLVEEPAIELDFLYFKKENFVHPHAGEHHDEFISRCMPFVINEGKEADQAYALCEVYWSEKMAALKVSFDYHDTLNTPHGTELAKKAIADGEDVYIISAGQHTSEFMPLAKEIGIDPSKVYAVGSNKAKVTKIKELGIAKHYDNNADVIAELGDVGMKFEIDTTGLTPYVDQEGPKKKIDDLLTKEQLETILEMASVLGVHESEVDYVSAFQFALNPKDAEYTPARTISQADGQEEVYKYMSSRVAGNSRQFCSRMMGLSRFYTREEIDALDTFNEEFGPGVGGGQYSIFKYKGGVNCQHYWQKYIAQRVGRRLQVTEATPTDNIQQMAETAPRTTQGRGYVKRPERNLPPLAGHSAFQLHFADEEKRVVVGPAMLPDISIPRRDEETGDIYYVKFSEETIKEIAMKYMKEARTNEVNTDHEVNDAGTYIFESWIVEDPKTDKANTVYGYNVPKGTWMVKMKVEDKGTWKRIKNGELKGFSVEGSFSDMEEIEARRRYEKILTILK